MFIELLVNGSVMFDVWMNMLGWLVNVGLVVCILLGFGLMLMQLILVLENVVVKYFGLLLMLSSVWLIGGLLCVVSYRLLIIVVVLVVSV